MQILPLQVLLPLQFNILKATNPGNLFSTTCWVKLEPVGKMMLLKQQHPAERKIFNQLIVLNQKQPLTQFFQQYPKRMVINNRKKIAEMM